MSHNLYQNNFSKHCKPSSNYPGMVQLFDDNMAGCTNDSNDKSEATHTSEFLDLSNVVQSVINNKSSYQVKKLSKFYPLEPCGLCKLASKPDNINSYIKDSNHDYKRLVNELNSKIRNSNELLFTRHHELETSLEIIKEKDLKISDMEDNLYQALKMILDFMSKYENSLLTD
ncbi:MAG: hypothetical protein AB1782_06830 [Cyanobacteriota bacterium]